MVRVHGIAANVDDLRPNVLAFFRADSIAHLARKRVVIGLGQRRANHPECAIAVVLKPMQ